MMMFSRNIRKVRWLAGEVELSVTLRCLAVD